MDNTKEVLTRIADVNVLSFRKVDEIKRLAKHFRNVINHPSCEAKPVVHNYLINLNETHKRIFLQKREGVEVEYIFTTEKKSNLQRQRFNSLPVSEVPELLKAELMTAGTARQVHICTDCNVTIDLNDEEPLMESLQKHFNLEVHLPKLKRESIDVAEPVILPNMSRRLSAMECGDIPTQNIEQILQVVKPTGEKLDGNFTFKLTQALLKHLPDPSEATVAAALKFYQEAYDVLSHNVSLMDFSNQTSSVAPIIMSIRDNVYQNFSADANKNIENDDSDQTVEKPKSQVKKYRYYGPIEALILKLLLNHRLLSLIDDRTGKLAFFCIACEYYTLRFHYDSVLNHVFSDTHVHNLSCILQSDKHIPFVMPESTVSMIKDMNEKFLTSHDISCSNGIYCRLCKVSIDSTDACIMHILDDKHLARLSDSFYLRMKASRPDGSVPEEWGPKDLNWTKFLASVGKPQNNRDHVIIENFIKPSGKVGNSCTCCDMTLKGPRQVLFNHVRQKKHLRNAAPRKLALLYKTYCRPAEFYACFGNYYICTLCPEYIAMPSFSAITEHAESPAHFENLAKVISAALFQNPDDLSPQKINNNACDLCKIQFEDASDSAKHILSDYNHNSCVADERTRATKGDIIRVYMGGNYVLHSEGATFKCVPCDGVFNSIRSLLMHLVYAEHFVKKPSVECVFRFYLELKHNINMLARNKYIYYEFGRLKCGVCDEDLADNENAKKHVMSPQHKERMGASYVNYNVDGTSAD